LAERYPIYRIADEPSPGAMSHLVVNPLWPLLGLMLGGVWLSFPWFVFNGYASGSPTRRRELAIALGGLGAVVVALVMIVVLVEVGMVYGTGVKYALLALTLIKLATGYSLYVTQRRSFDLYEYYGGVIRNGVGIVILGFIIGPRLMELVPWPLLWLVIE
jgi:hypothetical protein